MYTQAPIEIENPALVTELKSAIENALIARADEFLHLVKRFGLKVRQFEQLLQQHVFGQIAGQQAANEVCLGTRRGLFARVHAVDGTHPRVGRRRPADAAAVARASCESHLVGIPS